MGDTAKCGYDAAYELTSVTYPDAAADTYTYDAMGNRLTKNSTSHTYNSAAREKLEAAGISSAAPMGYSVPSWDNEVIK